MNQSGSFMLHLDKDRKTLADYFDKDQDSFAIYTERDTHTQTCTKRKENTCKPVFKL